VVPDVGVTEPRRDRVHAQQCGEQHRLGDAEAVAVFQAAAGAHARDRGVDAVWVVAHAVAYVVVQAHGELARIARIARHPTRVGDHARIGAVDAGAGLEVRAQVGHG
jgi:hypothetical protein